MTVQTLWRHWAGYDTILDDESDIGDSSFSSDNAEYVPADLDNMSMWADVYASDSDYY